MERELKEAQAAAAREAAGAAKAAEKVGRESLKVAFIAGIAAGFS